ncbi:MAG: hypothetical protein Q4D98_02995 [Planctomycetia bacterium]|nr:hypothetical protein [Planctomycetia bacterium]
MPEFGYKKHPGDRSLSAGAWNRLVAKNTQPNIQPPQVVNQPRDTNLVQLENTCQETQNPFAVWEISNATWPDREADVFTSEGMRRGVEIAGETPSEEWHNIAIGQRSVPTGYFTPGVTSGPTPCLVQFPDAASLNYPYAIPIKGDTEKLQASPYGWIRILWHEDPDPPMEGCNPQTLKAYVNMGEDSQWMFFKLEEDLPECGCAQAYIVDRCGEQVGECKIIKEVCDSRLIARLSGSGACDPCGGGSTAATSPIQPVVNETDPVGTSQHTIYIQGGGSPKAGDIVVCWWFQYFEKWIAIDWQFGGEITETPQSYILRNFGVPYIAMDEAEEPDEDGCTPCSYALVLPQNFVTVTPCGVCSEKQQPIILPLPNTAETTGTIRTYGKPYMQMVPGTDCDTCFTHYKMYLPWTEYRIVCGQWCETATGLDDMAHDFVVENTDCGEDDCPYTGTLEVVTSVSKSGCDLVAEKKTLSFHCGRLCSVSSPTSYNLGCVTPPSGSFPFVQSVSFDTSTCELTVEEKVATFDCCTLTVGDPEGTS